MRTFYTHAEHIGLQHGLKIFHCNSALLGVWSMPLVLWQPPRVLLLLHGTVALNKCSPATSKYRTYTQLLLLHTDAIA